MQHRHSHGGPNERGPGAEEAAGVQQGRPTLRIWFVVSMMTSVPS